MTDENTDDQLTADDRSLPGSRVRVLMADGSSFVVRQTNPDYIRWDMTAPRQKWGTAQEVPFLARSFITWAAATREKLTTLKWDDFREQALDIKDLPEGPEDVARPTGRAPGHTPS